MLMGSNGREAPGPATAAGASKGGQVRGGRSSKFMGVVSKFQAQLGELATLLAASDCFFIRCIKPNAQLQPRSYAAPQVLGLGLGLGLG